MRIEKAAETRQEIRGVLFRVHDAPLRRRPFALLATFRPDALYVTYLQNTDGTWTTVRAELSGKPTTVNGGPARGRRITVPHRSARKMAWLVSQFPEINEHRPEHVKEN